MSNEYDISRAFKRIENDLIDSMMRNMKRHQVEEADLGIEWEQWQALQLQELERFRAENAQLFGDDFQEINEKIDDMFWATYRDAQSAEEHRLMDRIKKGDFTPPIDKGSFFNLNEGKLQALLMATKADFARAEYALLRQANDQYRKLIFDAMTYANVTNDYKKAVEMATKDFVRGGVVTANDLREAGLTYEQIIDMSSKQLLKAGLRPVVYKNGSRHSISEYASMALRTGNKRAYLMGEGNAHDRYGLHTVRVNKRPHACPKCVGFLGRILIDDVYGGGSRAEATAMGIPTLSDAIGAGFLHPNCKDMYSVYIPGISKPAQPWTEEEISDIVGEYNQEQEIRHAEDMRDTYQRMAKYSLDPENQATYQQRADDWQIRLDELSAEPPIPVIPAVTEAIIEEVTTKAGTFDRNAINWSAPGKALETQMKNAGIEYREVKLLDKALSEEEIINRIAGGDLTQGSCMSLAQTYIGNKCGYDVLDFRGGQSGRIMALSEMKITSLNGLNAIKEKGSTIRPAKALLAKVEAGKEYYFITGRHTAIVRKVNGELQYLELQSADKSGWHPFEEDVILFKGSPLETTKHYTLSDKLKDRFGCASKSAGYSYLVDIEEYQGSDEFRELLGYVNTAEDAQKKGALGSVK